MKMILASASPRRKELLKQIGVDYEVLVSDAEEKTTATAPEEVVEELARQKAVHVFNKYFQNQEAASDEELLILAADTIVACDGQILGKPKDAEEAKSMLRLLQGRGHEVYTGVTFLYRRNAKTKEQIHTFYEVTRVHFYPMTETEIEEYVAAENPLNKTGISKWDPSRPPFECEDKAGAYGIQGLCARYIRGIEGDYNNVVGLPVGRVYEEMKKICYSFDGRLNCNKNFNV